MRLNLNHKLRDEHRRGQSMVEFALAIPIFLLLVFGIVEFGRMFLMYTSVFAAARECARYGAAVETLCDQIGLEDAARRVGFFAGDMNIAIQYDNGYWTVKACEETVLGDRVHVTTEIRFRSITGIVPEFTLRSIARRTIIKEARVGGTLTLGAPSEIAGDIPPAVTFGPYQETITPDGTITPQTPSVTPLPPCKDWVMSEIQSETDTIYVLKFSKTTDNLQWLSQVTINWDGNNRKLEKIEYKTPSVDYIIQDYPNTTKGTYTWIPSPPGKFLYEIGDYYLRFTFSKSETVTGIILNLFGGTGYCSLNIP